MLDVPSQKALVALSAELWLRGCVEPSREKFSKRNLGCVETTTEVAFAQNSSQIFLGAACGAVDSSVVVAPPASLAVASEKDADEPALTMVPDDLKRSA